MKAKEYWFSFFFLILLTIDIVFNNFDNLYNYRIISKPLISISLMLFYVLNNVTKSKKEKRVTILALVFALIGDLFLLEGFDFYSFHIGLFAFFLTNIAYSYLLYRSAQFEINKSLPFLIVTSIYLIIIYYLIYDNLQEYFILVLVYFFVILNMTQSAFLRYRIVNNRSFYFVFIGALFFTVAGSIIALNMFYKPIPYKNIFIMLFYGIGQLLMIQGILIQQKKFRRF